MNSAFTRKINGLNRFAINNSCQKIGITGMTNKRKDDISPSNLILVFFQEY